MNILVLSPQPFFQARGTPIAVRLVLEFLSSRGHRVDVLTYHEGSDVEIPNCRILRIPRIPGVRNIRPGFSFKKILCDLVMLVSCTSTVNAASSRVAMKRSSKSASARSQSCSTAASIRRC